MTIKPEELKELKRIYFRHYQRQLSDEQALELGTRLVNLFKVITKPIPIVDKEALTDQNGVS